MAAEEKIDKLDEVRRLLFNIATSCEVCLKVNEALVAQGHFSETQRQLAAAEYGLDMVEWLRKEKVRRKLEGRGAED